ncbi:MAG: hypothetical protein J7507_13030 [Pseudoxanthomonas sp.]|nr:hypothetical protein [Pseudoxanthomonas sp.]
MAFLDAAQAASFPALATYVVAVMLIRVFRWRRVDPLHLLGGVAGIVVAAGLVAQFALDGSARSLVFGLAAGLGIGLFRWFGRCFPGGEAQRLQQPG